MTEPAWAGSLAARAESALLPTYARFPLELVSGSGATVTDSRGRQYLDFVAGIAVSALGHAHPDMVSALRGAADGLLHVSNLYWTEPMVRLAERLVDAGGMEKAFFCNSGAESVEAALKLARKARPGRPGMTCFDGSFHGRTFGALSVTARPAYQEPFRPLLPRVRTAPFGSVEALAEAVDEQTGVAIVEPIQGEGGVRPAPEGWLAALRARCDEVGALLVFDEVQSGVGRTGTFFAWQGERVRPDVVTAAKALAGGLPMGVVLARGEAAAAFAPGDHASTFGGGPFTCAASHAVLDVVLAEGFLGSVRARGEVLGDGLVELAGRHELVAEARGRGLMWGLVLRRPVGGELVAALQREGVLCLTAGPDVLRLVPPLIVEEQQVLDALAALDRALARLEEA